MAIVLDVKIDGLADIAQRLQKMGARMADLRDASEFIGEEMKLRTQQRMGKGLDIHSAPFKPSKRAGYMGTVPLGGSDHSLANSVNYDVTSDGLELFSTHIGAGVHQRGDTIRPKAPRKFLTIPLRAVGGSRFAGNQSVKAGNAFVAQRTVQNRDGARARHYKDTFFRRKFGKLYLMQRLAGAKKVVALFLLVTSVTMPKNEWLGFTKDDEQMVIDTYAEHLDTFGERK